MSIADLRDAIAEFDQLAQRTNVVEAELKAAEARIVELKRQLDERQPPTPSVPTGWKEVAREDCGAGVMRRISRYGDASKDWNMTAGNTAGFWNRNQFTETGDSLVLTSEKRDSKSIKGAAFAWTAGGDALLRAPFLFVVRTRNVRRDPGHGFVWQAWSEEDDGWPTWGEYDISEHYPDAPVNRSEANIHYNPGKPGIDRKYAPVTVSADFSQWHTWHIEVSDRVQYSFNGEPFLTVVDPSWVAKEKRFRLTGQHEGRRLKPNLEGRSEIEVDFMSACVPA